jgi:ketosteroid isomerase-like protein
VRVRDRFAAFAINKGGEEQIVKQRMTVLGLALLMMASTLACQTDSTKRAATTDQATNSGASGSSSTRTDKKATVDEIHAVLAQHDKVLSDKNLDALMDTFSSDPNTVVLGTGTEERWVGPQEIRAAYTEIFKDYDPGTLQAKCDWKTGNSDDAGTMAWLAAICGAKDSMQGKTRDYKLNVSATVQKQDGKWRFVMLHMSNAFQPPVTK